jgi:photosystem II stability/assembly factor-like uncharacterized protein
MPTMFGWVPANTITKANVIYGDGVYKSEDGGSSWKNMGLKASEHIGGIVIDPKNSNVVYVAAYGSLRNEGGDRGIFKTSDGGKTWRNVLKISPYTGCFQVHMDPRYNTTLYAVAHQRMRKGYTNISGGDESAIYRSMDSGATWQKIMKGLPSENVGRIGMAVSPANQISYMPLYMQRKKVVFTAVITSVLHGPSKAVIFLLIPFTCRRSMPIPKTKTAFTVWTC